MKLNLKGMSFATKDNKRKINIMPNCISFEILSDYKCFVDFEKSFNAFFDKFYEFMPNTIIKEAFYRAIESEYKYEMIQKWVLEKDQSKIQILFSDKQPAHNKEINKTFDVIVIDIDIFRDTVEFTKQDCNNFFSQAQNAKQIFRSMIKEEFHDKLSK